MDLLLDPVEVRVLGALIEKDVTTPEYYPLTLNALINACNQKSNREPVVSYDEDTVSDAVDQLREKRLVGTLTGGSNRVPKYAHRLQEALNLGRRETALLCELMLRGPQTLGELKDRAGRMHKFNDLEEVERCLRTLMEFPARPLATLLQRQAGQKEARYAHLLSGEPQFVPMDEAPPVRSGSALESRVAALETEVRDLKDQLARVLRELGVA